MGPSDCIPLHTNRTGASPNRAIAAARWALLAVIPLLLGVFGVLVETRGWFPVLRFAIALGEFGDLHAAPLARLYSSPSPPHG